MSTACCHPQIGRRALLGMLAGGTSTIALAGCVPASVGQAFAPPPNQIQQLADQAWARTLQQHRVWRNGAANAQAQRVASRLIPLAGRPNLNWEVVVFDDPGVNAFALPNGKIGLYRGMMERVANDDQLAAVIGHELGHVTAQHAAARVGTAQVGRLGASLGGALLGGTPQETERIASLLGAGATVGVVLPFSRQQELEADQIGVRYMAQAGYNPAAAVAFWEARMREGGRTPLEFLSTHPSDAQRLENLRRIVFR